MIIMDIYHELIDDLSAHMIHINLNNITYTCRAVSYSCIYIKYYLRPNKTTVKVSAIN